jgi:hypothetical protein
MNILSKFPSSYQIAEQDGRFYFVYLHRPELCCYCIKRAERNDPDEFDWHSTRTMRPEILKELTAETLWVALFADATETLDFNPYDMRYDGHVCDEYGLNGCNACMEEYCEGQRQEREFEAEQGANEWV